MEREMHEDISKTGLEPNQFWNKIWEQSEHNRKAECMNNIEKDLQG